MDKLDTIFNSQVAFQKLRNLFVESLSIEDTKEISLLLYGEIADILRCIGWKALRADKTDIIQSNLHVELIDILKYWLVLANMWGLTPDKIVEVFNSKSEVVAQRWMQQLDLNLKDKPIICVDIDGVLCDYLDTWFRFLGANKIAFSDKRIDSLDLSRTLEHPEDYPRLKALFRESGQKRGAVVIYGAAEFLKSLSDKYNIVIVSARPVKQYQRIYSDTIEWLSKNGLKYSALVFEEDKREWVINHADTVAFCVDDDPNQAMKLANVGIKVYLLSTPYNQGIEHPNITRVLQLVNILEKEGL